MAYLLMLLVLIGCMVLLDARYRLFVFHRPLPAMLSLVLGTGIFVLWDVLAINEGIFLHLESRWMTGLMVADQLPLEEILFLLFLCYQTMLLVNGWQLVRSKTRSTRARGK